MKTALIAAALLAATPALAQDAGADISFTFEVGHPSGQVMLALFDSEAAYDGSGGPVRVQRAEVSGSTVTVRFAGLPAGDYALKAFHDLDGDGEMDRNPFGLPTEPYVFSNNAVGNMGPASWERARFTASGAVAQTLILR
ncbi:DUF2141 domain-containing protein [Brevundimonas sp.]|uniref:DUF2141 domain-containing protein n=1 Tax=Brevundimonas sp. TaxID=1871086 RepID=UPI0025EFF8FA|nr:DUF2141 domain-containing protein [Brevundimonas sp.]